MLVRMSRVCRGACIERLGIAIVQREPRLARDFLPPLRHRRKARMIPRQQNQHTPEGPIMKTNILASLGTRAILAAGVTLMAPSSPHAQGAAARYEFDASWNRPFPNRWINGGLGGLCVDANDHVLVLHSQGMNKPQLAAGAMAPPMLEFDSAGNLVHSWGDPKLIDSRLHSCHYDKDGNVWIASAPSGMVQKYSHDGSKLLLTIGKKGVYDTSDGTEKGKPLNSPLAAFHMPSSIFVDRGNGDV